MFRRAGLIYRTLRHVPPVQLWYYFLRRGLPVRYFRQPSVQVPGEVLLKLAVMPPLPNIVPVIHSDSFFFLNQISKFGVDQPDWRARDMSRLWRYHLHYFDWLKDDEFSNDFRAFTIDHWIENNPLGFEDAWEPYTVSLRMINWIVYCFRRAQLGLEVKTRWIHSLAEQGNWLSRNLEFHIRGNHLLKNRFAMVWFRLFFRSDSDDRYLLKACFDLQDELLEQFNGDGGHYERSPTYHAICIEHCIALFDALKCAAVSTPLVRTLYDVINNGLRFLAFMSFSDGKVSLVGDSTLHGAHSWQRLSTYWNSASGDSFGREVATAMLLSFPETGFVVWQFEHGKLIISTGGPSPSYQPGHSHCDAGGFELEFMGRRVIVDSGVSQYAPGPMRNYVRSSRAHNVFSVEDQDQNEIWGEFRVGARIQISRVDVSSADDYVQVSLQMVSHCASSITFQHTRTFTLRPGLVQISDMFNLDKAGKAYARLHFHPDFDLYNRDRAWFIDGCPGISVNVEGEGGMTQQLESSYYCPDFGIAIPNQCLLITQNCGLNGVLNITIQIQSACDVVNT